MSLVNKTNILSQLLEFQAELLNLHRTKPNETGNFVFCCPNSLSSTLKIFCKRKQIFTKYQSIVPRKSRSSAIRDIHSVSDKVRSIKRNVPFFYCSTWRQEPNSFPIEYLSHLRKFFFDEIFSERKRLMYKIQLRKIQRDNRTGRNLG